MYAVLNEDLNVCHEREREREIGSINKFYNNVKNSLPSVHVVFTSSISEVSSWMQYSKSPQADDI